MKKYLLFALLICTVFALTACSSSFTCGFCDQEKKGEKHTTNGYYGSETTICDDCYKSTKDYIYSFADGGATINKYTGEATELEVPSSIGKYPVTKIGDYAFADRVNLLKVIIPQSVTSIGKALFYNCNNLISVAIPDRAMYEYSDTFEMCKVTNVFEYNVVNGEAIITDYSGNARELEIPFVFGKYPVTGIGERAFQECKNLWKVTIPNRVTSIGYGAFASCNGNLVIYGEANSCAENYAHNNNKVFFYSDSNSLNDIKYVITGNKAVITGYNGSATKVEIPSMIAGYPVTRINNSAFYACSNLTSVTIPNSVISIGEYAFNSCSNLTSVTIPNSVTSIGKYAFNSCSSLTSVIIPDSTNIGDYAFSKCSSKLFLLFYKVNNGEATITNCTYGSGAVVIPSMIGKYPVTCIGKEAFEYCHLTSVTIPDSITNIESSAFYNCDSLTSVTIPDSVTSIESSAFRDCDSLTSVTIPDSVTSIGSYAFYNCDSLTSVTIPDSVTSIGAYAFKNCSSLTSVTITDGVTSIGDEAFSGCSSLTSVTIPDSVTSIGAYAFKNCSSLTSVTIADGVTSIGDEAFSGCSSLTSATIPDSVTSIGGSAFYLCKSLTLMVEHNSYAAQYARENNIEFAYPDALDWLNN